MAAPYRIEFAPSAKREFKKLPPDLRKRVGLKIARLADDPRPPGSKKLTGSSNEYRIRIGDWRVIYLIEDGVLLVIVTRVGHRSDVYD